MDETECPICTDKYTKELRKRVSCPYCNYGSCVKCYRQYFLSSYNDPSCIGCRREFNREFIDTNFTATFRKSELKLHRETVLCDREKSLLASTMPFVEREQERREMNRQRGIRMKQYEEFRRANRIAEDAMLRQIERETAVARNNEHQLGVEGEKERKVFSKPCVVSGCRGFLSSQYRCGVCETHVCSECYEVKKAHVDPEHVCKPEDIESVLLLKKECKPCPKCSIPIFRISGCDQMFCVECGTPFSWRTGKEIVTNNIHNPHYAEWRAKNGKNSDAGTAVNHCLTIVRSADISRKFRTFAVKSSKVLKHREMFESIARIAGEIRDYGMERVGNGSETARNLDLRVSYILKELEEEEWKKTLQIRERKRDFSIAKNQVNQMFVDVLNDYLLELVAETFNPDNIQTLIDNINLLISYYHQSMKDVHARFLSKAHFTTFNENWGLKV